MDRYVDMHCHIIPRVDDGAADMEEAVKMLQTAYNEGIRLIIATPHYHPRRGHESLEVIREQLRMLREEAAKIDEKFRIYLGREIYYGQDIPELISQGRTGTLNGRNVVLLEFSPADSFEYIRQGIQYVQMTGNEVILAHAERYQCLTDNVELAEKLYDMGVNIQINADSITGNGGRKVKKFIKELAKQDMIFGIGTDAHGSERRAPLMKKAAEQIKRKYGEDYMRRIFFDNPGRVIEEKKRSMNQYMENTVTDTDNDEITIDLREIFGALLRKAQVIILCGIVAALLAFIGTKFLITPMYTSETKVYVMSKTGENGMNSGDFQVGTYLTKDYMELVKSRTVMEQVIASLDLDMQPNELKDQITVSSATDTRILSISVSNENPKLAKEIADTLREVVSIQITDIMGADAVNTVDPAYLPKTPSSPNTMKNTVLGGLLGCILAMAVVIVIYILDDTIKTPEDVERYLGLNVLTSIPIEEGERQSAGERRKKKAQTRKNLKKTKRK